MTAVIVSPVQVAFGALTSLADGAMVKLARLGTVNAPPSGLAEDDDMGVPTLLPMVDEPVGASGVGDSLAVVEGPAGELTPAALSEGVVGPEVEDLQVSHVTLFKGPTQIQ